ncbi:DHA2 family efflux MFS transporter permease subunit [Companilactobacillus versmoldensis]|uniref:Major facilitator superfamily permease n=1 Tax=Companilactobacillus versmoldensis DSM 14857 = KCTC 3814 TaxID=1423815 RepID=A0A0R1SIJ2_9LACO|nr:DHA2 family efflux MFS transporter permease subunit [Companilactobacillus versmoldensis]KRL67332.1 major facilitator superfamily permease [Companilactobacillus versmoldensis DSM 14857 = KCTC 3814]
MSSTKKINIQTKLAHPYLALMGVLIGGFVGMLSETSLNIALPSIMKAFSIETGTAQWLVTGYMLVIAIVLPLSSLLTKHFSTRGLVRFGLLIFVVGSIISALALDFAMLLTGRMIQGIGTGIILPLMFSIAMRIFPPNKLGAALGVAALVIMFAPAIGPTLAGIILGVLSWRWIFWSFIIFLVIALAFMEKNLTNVFEVTKPKVDWLAICLSTVSFGLIVFGISFLSKNMLIAVIALIIGLIFLVIYIRQQLHADTPTLDFGVLKTSRFVVGSLLVMIDFGITLSAMYLLPMYLQSGLGVAVALTGVIMLPGGVVNALTSFFAGRAYDKIGAKIMSRLGFLISAIGSLMFIFSGANSSLGYIIAAHIILMIGVPMAMSPSQTYGLNSLDEYQSADGSAIINTFQQVIGAVATGIATILLSTGQASYMANGGHSEALAFTQGAHYGFTFTLVLAILGFIIAFAVHDKGSDQIKK